MVEEILTECMKQAVLAGFNDAAAKKAKAQAVADKLLAGLKFLQSKAKFNSFRCSQRFEDADAPAMIRTSLTDYQTSKPLDIKVLGNRMLFDGKIYQGFSDRSINRLLTAVAVRAEYQDQGLQKDPAPSWGGPAVFMS